MLPYLNNRNGEVVEPSGPTAGITPPQRAVALSPKSPFYSKVLQLNRLKQCVAYAFLRKATQGAVRMAMVYERMKNYNQLKQRRILAVAISKLASQLPLRLLGGGAVDHVRTSLLPFFKTVGSLPSSHVFEESRRLVLQFAETHKLSTNPSRARKQFIAGFIKKAPRALSCNYDYDVRQYAAQRRPLADTPLGRDLRDVQCRKEVPIVAARRLTFFFYFDHQRHNAAKTACRGVVLFFK